MRTTRSELSSNRSLPHADIARPDAFAHVLEKFENERSLENSVDLLDACILTGDRYNGVRAARRIKELEGVVSHRVLAAARYMLAGVGVPVYPELVNAREDRYDYLFRAISRLKSRISTCPRDALSHIEVARLYSRLGQFAPAEASVRRAVILAPDDRFVLRCATRFFTMRRETEEALKLLWKSSAIRDDPWIQSAEVAAAELSGRSIKFGHKALKSLRSAKSIPKSHSELALALATLQEKNGAKRRETFKLVGAALGKATENALTQAVWLSEFIGRGFFEEFPDAKIPKDAHEARAIELFELSRFEESEDHAARWFQDQPFQGRAASTLSHLNLIHLARYDVAAAVAEQGLIIHPNDWSLINCALLGNALQGNSAKARQQIVLLDAVTKDEILRPFFFAAHGMVNFLEGHIEIGRQYYDDALLASKKAKRPDLMINAVLFRLEREAAAGSMAPSGIRGVMKEIDDAVVKLPPLDRKDLEKIWKSRRAIIENYLSQEVFQLEEGEGQARRLMAALP